VVGFLGVGVIIREEGGKTKGTDHLRLDLGGDLPGDGLRCGTMAGGGVWDHPRLARVRCPNRADDPASPLPAGRREAQRLRNEWIIGGIAHSCEIPGSLDASPLDSGLAVLQDIAHGRDSPGLTWNSPTSHGQVFPDERLRLFVHETAGKGYVDTKALFSFQ